MNTAINKTAYLFFFYGIESYPITYLQSKFYQSFILNLPSFKFAVLIKLVMVVIHHQLAWHGRPLIVDLHHVCS